MDIKEMKTEDVITVYSEAIKELKSRNIIRTNNVIGELGEYLAIKKYNETAGLPKLLAAQVGTKNIDAVSKDGERYSIKSTSGKTTGVFYGLEPKGSSKNDKQEFEYVVICKFNDDYELEMILELSWTEFLKYKHWHSRMRAWNLSITKKMISDAHIIYKKV